MVISQLVESAWTAMPNVQDFSGFLNGLLASAEQDKMGQTRYAKELGAAIRLAPEAKNATDLLRLVDEALRSIDEASPGP